MKSIGIDFSNRMLCIMTEGQQGTERDIEELSDISKFYCFIPEQYRNHTSYTWNFEDETFSVNQDYCLEDGCIMTKECFVPEVIVPMPGLKKRWNEMTQLLDMEEVNLKEELKKDMPGIAKLFGWE
ncbi:MAG: hypothetical protein MJZ37_09720 [Bacilli bacterium]|nr:hypothetical protein [Bacilli bacterium]